jgi:pantoate--beta-alanine ligase
MKVAKTISEFLSARSELSTSVGFAPTMGSLHRGHLALVRQARAENTSVVVSIFVNPAQFGPHEDFAEYPRDLDRDVGVLADEGVDLVFAPSTDELYTTGHDTWVEVKGISERLEGAIRSGHFRGVATVVAKLFHLVRPQRAYFGQKDAQQAIVIKRLITDLNFDVELVVAPTVREEDGLAMSSRNAYLTPDERRAATVLYLSLQRVEQSYLRGTRDADKLRDAMRKLLATEPLIHPSYVSVADPDTLEELATIDRSALVSLAVQIGTTRLIDNTMLPPESRLT